MGHGDGDAGTCVWDTGLRDVRPGAWGRMYGGTWGCGDLGKQVREIRDARFGEVRNKRNNFLLQMNIK